MPNRLLTIALFMAFLLPSAAFAQCGPYDSPIDCERAQAALQARTKRLQELGQLRADTIRSIEEARARFWATYPDKPGAAKAREEFAYWLFVKDIYYLRENLRAPALKDATGRRTTTPGAAVLEQLSGFQPLDGGIRKSASPEFEEWVGVVRNKVFEGHTSNSTDDAFMQGILSTWMGATFWNALASADKQYQAYVIERDWWEFDNVKRVPAGFDSPDAYGVLLYSRWEGLSMPKATAAFQTFARLVGPNVARAAAKQVYDAPKTAGGGLVVTAKPPVKIGPGGSPVDDYDVPMPDNVIGTWGDPCTAMEILATRGSAHTYLLYLLKDRNIPDGRKIDRATQWTFAEAAYKRLALAFGEPSLLAAAEKVRTAKKRMISNTIMNQVAIGATRNEPMEALEDILARGNTRGLVKAALMFDFSANGALDTQSAVDAAYQKFVAAGDEKTVLAAAGRIVAGKPHLTYNHEIEELDSAMASGPGTTKAPAPAAPMVDSPRYLAWRDFTPGAKATYTQRALRPSRPGATEMSPGPVSLRQTFQLRSIGATEAQLWLTEVVYDPNGAAHPASDSETTYPVKEPASPAVVTTQTGEETLTVKGQPIKTRWSSVQTQSGGCGGLVTTWTSDNVPGGLVRRREDLTCRGRANYRETMLDSFAGVRTAAAGAATRPAPAAVTESSPPPPVAPPPDRRAAPVNQPTTSNMSDEEFVRSKFVGGLLPLITAEPIELAGVDAGKLFRAKIDLRGPASPDGDRLASLMSDLNIMIRAKRSGPRNLTLTVDSVAFRSATIPLTTSNALAMLVVKPEFAHTAIRGTIPDFYWVLAPKTRMVVLVQNRASVPPRAEQDVK